MKKYFSVAILRTECTLFSLILLTMSLCLFTGCHKDDEPSNGKNTSSGGSGGSSTSNVAYKSCPDDKHPHLIDLALPSGTMWACCNVGAKKPEEFGGHYAWGETTTKQQYSWGTYIHCDGSSDNCHDIGDDIAGTIYDAATVNWGKPWQMPTTSQFDELWNTNRMSATVNGVSGVKFVGSNGGTLFLPHAGLAGYGYEGRAGWYFSSIPNNSYVTYYGYGYAWGLYFEGSGGSLGYERRYYGHSIRPCVKAK